MRCTYIYMFYYLIIIIIIIIIIMVLYNNTIVGILQYDLVLTCIHIMLLI